MDTYKTRLSKLNDRQTQAVEAIDGPLMVIAGPGSGKTELLSIRTAKILEESQISPQNILLLTFTDSASFNMRERLVSLIGEAGYRVSIYTFHSFASDIISRYPEYFFDGAKFAPASEIDQLFAVEDILKNLPKKNSLRSFHPEQGFVYSKSILQNIADLKKSGLTPETFQKFLEENTQEYKEINNILSNLKNSFEKIANKRRLSEILPTYLELYKKLESVGGNYAKVLLSTLGLAVARTEALGKSTPLTEWKNDYLSKEEGSTGPQFVLRDSDRETAQKLQDLSTVYQQYTEAMYASALYDFDDMILLAGATLEKYPNLRYDLQERYQYILIDEFQDTNEAQFQLVKDLLKNEGGQVDQMANLMVVGDDDQAIYKFQGAEIGNIFEFTKTFPGAKKIILDKNYRSTQEVLDFSRKVITKAVDRLEVRDGQIVKDIRADNQKLLDSRVGTILEKSFENDLEEYNFIATEVRKILGEGVAPSEVAVICRKHEGLKKLANVLSLHQIPYSYERKENVLEKPHVKELINIANFAHLNAGGEGAELLPEILSYKFWGLSSLEVWKVAERALSGEEREDEFGKKVFKKISWLEAMQVSENAQVREIAQFLIDLSVEALSTPLEYLLDKIIGTDEWLWHDDEHADREDLSDKKEEGFISPYRKYYFNNQKFEHNKPEYLDFLFSLRTFIGALREFKKGSVLYAKDLPEFLDLYNGNGLTLTLISPFASSEKSVNLLTAHRAKGLEFEYVFILSADDDVWASRGMSNKIRFPKNLRLGPEGDNDDDKIRLLFVALTRAKHTLYITNSSQKVRYLLGDATNAEVDTEYKEVVGTATLQSLEMGKSREFVQEETVLLKRLLENYKMPVTHLSNFLNFTKVGPSRFVEQNLLRFPQAMSGAAVYGSAMHEAVEKTFLYFQKYQALPKPDFLTENFRNSLLRGRLPEVEHKKYSEAGLEALEIYYKDLNERGVSQGTKVEVKFANENVYFGKVHATGNIDKMEFQGEEVIVTDLKTGEAFTDFEGGNKKLSEYEKIKLHFYKYQLAYYALLLENSRSYSKYKVSVGRIEFLEPDYDNKIQIIELELDQELKSRVQKLSEIVFSKILNLDFPDTSSYKESLKGVLQFEDDLLSGKI